ncbi:hypothetical protein KQI88_15330 [Alkaliphilus sp. MSJ-5]|uniref:Bacteriophage holin of superfamily 6 (Holin_LLH) n=1 Tax=Alkaliphilus flagellatus TaxID=2841507 RepID=A0ABS6G8Q2_9FIRM|nr:hypothetical protein [Alkaliphilus flagellatus]MBU5677790.1 hypothetical protein [Alkaliphilus flagellatus]
MIELIQSFIMINLIEVAGTIIVVTIGLWLYKRGQEDFLRKLVLALATEAEKQLGSGTGELKYAMVVERIYEITPGILKLLYSKKQIDKMIEDAVEYLKRYLASGKNLLGYDKEING